MKAKQAMYDADMAVGTSAEMIQQVKEAVTQCKNKENGRDELLEVVDGIKQRKARELEICKEVEKKAGETVKKLEKQLVEIGEGVREVVFEMVKEVRKEYGEKIKMIEEERDGLINDLVALITWHCDDLKPGDVEHEILEKNITKMSEWTGKLKARILYDSKKNEFTNAEFNKKCLNQSNIAIVGFTTDGDVFGGYLEQAITKTSTYFNDQNHFVFSLESHGRCQTPQRWFQKNRSGNTVYWRENCSNGFIKFGDGNGHYFYLGNEQSDSYCYNLSGMYDGIQDTTLTGKNGSSSNTYHFSSSFCFLMFLFLIS